MGSGDFVVRNLIVNEWKSHRLLRFARNDEVTLAMTGGVAGGGDSGSSPE